MPPVCMHAAAICPPNTVTSDPSCGIVWPDNDATSCRLDNQTHCEVPDPGNETRLLQSNIVTPVGEGMLVAEPNVKTKERPSADKETAETVGAGGAMLFRFCITTNIDVFVYAVPIVDTATKL